MNNKKGKWFVIIALGVFIVGMIFCIVMSIYNWDFTKLQTTKYETNDYKINKKFDNISILTDTADIIFVPSENEKTTITCYEQQNVLHTVSAKEDTLSIEINDTRKWYEYIGISFSTPKITVNIPVDKYNSLTICSDTGIIEIPDEYIFENIDIKATTGSVAINASAKGSFKVKTSTGNISVANANAGTIDLSVSTGKISVSNLNCVGKASFTATTGETELHNLKCGNLNSEGSTGSIVLENVIAKTKFSILRDTGDIIFNKSDAAEIIAETDTGDIKGTLLSDKIFLVETDTGRINVPKTTRGGKCEIKTDTGDIDVRIEN